ncbi:hypothetical protein CN118_37335, partial [Sinorhizobium meliloti]
ERPSGRATPSLRDAPGDAPIQIDAVPKLIVAPHLIPRTHPQASPLLEIQMPPLRSKSARGWTTRDMCMP